MVVWDVRHDVGAWGVKVLVQEVSQGHGVLALGHWQIVECLHKQTTRQRDMSRGPITERKRSEQKDKEETDVMKH